MAGPASNPMVYVECGTHCHMLALCYDPKHSSQVWIYSCLQDNLSVTLCIAAYYLVYNSTYCRT